MYFLRHLAFSSLGLLILSILVVFLGSQIFWLGKIRSWKQRHCRCKALRMGLDGLGAALYVILIKYGIFGARQVPSPTRMTLGAALAEAPFAAWVFGSVVGFIFYLVLRGFGLPLEASLRLLRGLRRGKVREAAPRGSETAPPAHSPSPTLAKPSRRQFFRQAATALGAVPFVAGAYGILYGRLDLTVTNPRISLPNLPKAFDGFRILQLSDLHIGPFMTAREIRKIVEISNRAKPDLIALTGDFVTWDASTQAAVVDALSGLKAPCGVWGSIGNHEIWTHTQDSITRLFAKQGVRILRQESAVIPEGRDFINLIGVDYQTQKNFGHYGGGFVREYLQGVRALMLPETTNILMSHNPNTFDRAAKLGIDLSLAGHTHGGQVSLEFVDINISPSRLITPYVEGWFQKGKGQLYVNRGIGTIGLPMRIGAPPEITIYHLARAPLPRHV